jgi:hemerythrin-like domain-containing protein
MEATTLLRRQHEQVISKFKQFEKADDEATRRKLFIEIADALAAHTTIEEKLFYPTAYRGEDLHDLLRESVEEHLSAKRLISDLLMMEVTDEQFSAKVKVLRDIIEHHVEEEHDDIFPKVKKMLSRGELTSLGEEMEKMFDQLITTEPRQNVPSETEHAAQLH